MPDPGHGSRLTRPHGARALAGDLRLSHVVGGLSAALDLSDGHLPGHAARSCYIGMRLGETIGLNDSERASLLVTLLLKDLGASVTSRGFTALFGADDPDIRRALRSIDWGRPLEAARFTAGHVGRAGWMSRGWRRVTALTKGVAALRDTVRTRADQGAEFARALKLPAETAQALRALDEHWDGGGAPLGIVGHAIHPFARIATLAQTLDVFWTAGGARAALEVVAARRARWFEPALVDALVCLKHDESFWTDLAAPDILARALAREPETRASKIEEGGLDLVAETFARVIDAKSPWTDGHSDGMADLAVRMGGRLGLSGAALTDLRRAAWLHDLGKLGVSNVILDKPGPLSNAERSAVQRHPAVTAEILGLVEGLADLAPVAAAHHERPDGQGYHLGLAGDALPLDARILSCADIADALRTSRPYRPALTPDRVLAVMKREVGQAIDRDCYEVLSAVLQNLKPAPSTAPVVHIVPALLEDYTQAA